MDTMNKLLDLDAKLTVLSNNPCACVVCVKAARFAKHVLMDISPSGVTLISLYLKQGTPEFAAAEAQFHADEIARLQDAYDTIGHGRCQMIPPPELDTSSPPLPPQYTVTPIPDLPDPELYRARIEHHHRRRRLEQLKRPRIPGSYLIK